MAELAYVNGTLSAIESARVPIEDRGYQFGDAVYEFIASYNGTLFCLEEHLDRLERSLRGLDFSPIPRDGIRKAILMLFEKASISRAGIYIQISRGAAPRNHLFPKSTSPQVVMTIREVEEKPAELRKNGAAAITVEDFRWGRCDLKTVQLLPNVLAKQKAIDAGAFDAIFISEGIVREATSSNFSIVSGGGIITHPLNQNILPGITRMVIIDLCKELKIPVHERFFNTEELFRADEAFLTGTVTEVLPIVQVDRRRIGEGRVGPVTQRLYEALRERAGA
ncbi:MAG: D-amino-acid transaminase [Deltaproteobacteria bacterium RBG_13_49_15]|nr:MAG: D-amino-acid transaminase [Deltaproteobacteria bacterium RBG_13_49_15]